MALAELRQVAKNSCVDLFIGFKCLPYQKKKHLCLQSVLERDQGDLQLSGSDCCFMLFLDWTFFLISLIQLSLDASHKAISSSLALQQHAVWSVKRDHGLKQCFSDH